MVHFHQPSRFARAIALGAALLVAPALSGCASDDVSEMTLANSPANLAVDPFLWEGAIETLASRQLAVSDPATGRIETVWGPTNVAGRESKVIVQIYPGDLSANSVAVEMRVREGGVDRGNDAQKAGDVQDAIFLRARQLRASIDE